jgi:hypothetical protein
MSRTPLRQTDRPINTTRRAGRAVPKRRNLTWLWAVAGLALVALIAGGAYWFLSRGTPGEIAGVQEFGSLSRDHTEEAVTYPQTPPVGGAHHATWQTCGAYSAPIANNHAVHSLEHGAVWFTYRPDLPAEQVEQLRELIRGHTHALLSPYPNLPSPVVASAWGFQLKVDSAGDERLAQFLNKYQRGRQTPEPGASCRGGISTPAAQ